MAEIKVSVVIPVYNACEYLAVTLESVCNQTLSDIEIICVDDGSTDGSREVIKEFALKDERIRLIEQKNLFAGAARNNGLAEAGGEYVVFWDADDFFHEKALEKLYNKITADGADICICDAYKYYTELGKSLCSDDFVKYGNLPEVTPFSKKDIPDKIFNTGANVPWNKMFRREFITKNGLQFQNVRKANDTYFVLMAFFLAEKITYVKNRLVHYRCDTDGSITSGKTEIPPCAFEAYSYLREELEKREDYSNLNRKSFINRAARGMLRVLHLPVSESEYEAVREFLITEGFEKLGLLCGEEMYDSKWVYADIQSVLTRTPEEHLLYKFSEARFSKDKIKSKAIKRKEQLDKKTKLLEKEEKTNEKLNEKLSSAKTKLSENKEQLNRAKTELAQLKKEKKALEKEYARLEKKYEALDGRFMALRRKWYVRLFVKIENIFKKKHKKTD